MSMQFLKPAGLRFITSRADSILNRTGKIPWYVYFIGGGVIYTVLAGVTFAESTWPVLAWICVISAPLGFYYAWGAWKQENRHMDDA